MRRILVVDDSAFITFLWKLTLAKGGYEVSEIHDGASALKLLANTQYDCVIVDYHMDHMDGLTLTENIRATPGYKTIPIVMITANCDDQLRQSARVAGINAWMSKPIHPDTLLSVIDRLCPLSA